MGAETFVEIVLAIILPPVGVFLRYGCGIYLVGVFLVIEPNHQDLLPCIIVYDEFIIRPLNQRVFPRCSILHLVRDDVNERMVPTPMVHYSDGDITWLDNVNVNIMIKQLCCLYRLPTKFLLRQPVQHDRMREDAT
ncbi:hypothetical protein CTI12_AA357690 [Artemisia annua]|uniref:Uncharacterized protein n=1 Tax=Artemisia annua TaxID=35608 RepID=A0A2U1MF26_ARTAN|nr:hypothetical protein CTI12_AA357690 [Artemisia annua]